MATSAARRDGTVLYRVPGWTQLSYHGGTDVAQSGDGLARTRIIEGMHPIFIISEADSDLRTVDGPYISDEIW